jgi:hypothetical protein
MTRSRSPWTCLLTLLLTAPVVAQEDAEAPAADPPPAAEAPATDEDTPRTVVGEDPTLDRPEQVFEAAQGAFNARDWAGFLNLISPERRDEFIGQTAISFAFLAEQPGVDPRVVQVVEDYLPANVNASDLMMGSEDPQADRVRLAKRMGRPEAFFAEAMNLGLELEHGEQAGEVQVTELAELETAENGETAKGLAVMSTPDGERRMRWDFEAFKGQWYLSMQ